jgi:hypothetical protein
MARFEVDVREVPLVEEAVQRGFCRAKLRA